MSHQDAPRIYLWPNLLTAGNLFCGFFAIMNILVCRIKQDGVSVAAVEPHLFQYYFWAVGLILGACVFDALDGRVARMVGEDSPFGREFDSLADIVSFGVAPALLAHEVVLRQIGETMLGWLVAFFYLLCGAMRLARFNCMAAAGNGGSSKEFQGCPIPAAAGVISSVTLCMLHVWQHNPEQSVAKWNLVLVVLVIVLSYLMFSSIPYPSFKGLSWRTKRSFPWLLCAVLVLALTAIYWWIMLPVLFVGYMLYGLVRPWVSGHWRKEIEDDPDEVEDEGKSTPPARQD